MRKLVSLLLALTLVFGLATTAFAAQEGTLTGGSITINDAVAGQTYNAYQILYLESYNATAGTYAYKANTSWATWLANQTTYVSIDDQGYVTWVEGADAAAFAKAAQAYATTVKGEGVNVSPDATATATTTTVSFTGLKLGYYLVDTTLGTLCSLDTTNPNVVMEEKNAAPENVKKVEEDSKANTDGAWGTTNDADIGQTVNFKSTITAQAGAENYVFHDTMSSGLTFGSVTQITLGDNTVATSNYTVKTSGLGDNCTFHVEFTQAFCDTLKANDQIVIFYTATLNEGAVIGLPGNPNQSQLSYGDSSNTSSNVTPPSKTITYTWDMDVLKYANGVESNVLEGVKFVLLNSDKTKVAKVSSGKITAWVEISTITDEKNKITWPAESILTTDSNGKIEIDGLDSDTYYLREIEALPGYNILGADEEVEITGATKASDSEDLTYTTKIVKINNQSGTELPSTGGMGTTIFYILGSVLVLAAGVLLVTKKRMSAEN